MNCDIVYIGNLQFYVDTKIIPVKDHTFSYISWGCYRDPCTREPIACLIGFNADLSCIGFIRVQNMNSNGKILPRITSYGTEYRSDIYTDRIKPEAEWARLGYRIKPDAIGELLFPSYHSTEYLTYYGRHEVIPINITNYQEAKTMVIHSDDLNEFAMLNGIAADDILTADLELELGEGEEIEYGDEE